MSDRTTHSDAAPSFGDDSTGYDPTTETFHARFEDDPGGLTLTLVEAVGAVADREPTAMTPLYETVDPESLSTLVESSREQPLEVSFAYEGCRVTVSNDGSLVVEPRRA